MKKLNTFVLVVAIVLLVAALLPDKHNWHHYFDIFCAFGSGFFSGILFLKTV